MAFELPKDVILGNFKSRRKRRKTPAQKRAAGDGNDAKHLQNIRKLFCCVQDEECSGPIEPHHLKQGIKERGGARRADDRWTVPLCHHHHINDLERRGSKTEDDWFRERGIDRLSLADGLWANRHSLKAMRNVLLVHWEQRGRS